MGVRTKATVMVVDDSDIVLEVVRTTLEAAGYRVLTRNHPSGCVALMLQEEPDLVLVDVAMPDVGGDTLVRCFGAAHPNSSSTVLLHSGLPAEVLKQKVLESGAHGFIRKTSNQTAFVREVAAWLRRDTQTGEESTGRSGETTARYSDDPDESTRSGVRNGAPKVVLLVDSDMVRLSNTRRQLHSEDLAFEFALSGAHALGLISGPTPPDLVVSNTETGDLSGIEVYRRAVAANPRWAERFVFFTAQGEEPAIVAFGSSFPGPMLFEPFESFELKRAIYGRLFPGREHIAAS